jgi:hypothetical protein
LLASTRVDVLLVEAAVVEHGVGDDALDLAPRQAAQVADDRLQAAPRDVDLDRPLGAGARGAASCG